MSAENIQLIRQAYQCFERRDFAGVARLFDPEIAVYESELLPWGGKYRGHEGARQFFTRTLENLEWNLDTESLIDAGDHVIQTGHIHGMARRTGRKFDAREVHVWALRDGRITEFAAYPDVPAMLAAVSG